MQSFLNLKYLIFRYKTDHNGIFFIRMIILNIFFLRLHYFERAIIIIDRRKASLLIYEQKRN